MRAAIATMIIPLTRIPVSSPRRRASRSMTTKVAARPMAYMTPYQ